MVNYGIGGVYKQHIDSIGNNGVAFGEPYMGDRLATFMGYLSDVDAGGATVFPSLGITVWPRRGDALLWSVKICNKPQLCKK